MRAELRDRDAFVPSATLEVESHSIAGSSARSYVRMGLACLAAIVMGVIPALVINHYRNAPTAAPRAVTAATPVGPATQAVAPSPTPPAPVAAAAAGSDTVPMVEMDGDEAPPDRTPTAHVHRPTAHPTKRPPPCDVYLHPHGCPH